MTLNFSCDADVVRFSRGRFPKECLQLKAVMQLLQFKMKMMVLLMSLFHSALGDEGLKCHNDFVNTFTCVWNTSHLDHSPPLRTETKCFLHVTVTTASEKVQQMSADSSYTNILTATVDFKSRRGVITSKADICQYVTCENSASPVAEIKQHRGSQSVVKVPPPERVTVNGTVISWKEGSPKSSRIQFYKFEIQYKSADQSWTDAKKSQTLNQCDVTLPEECFDMSKQYVVRVRVKPRDLINATWSEWSTEYNWISEVGNTPPSPTPVTSQVLWLSEGGYLKPVTLICIIICIIIILSSSCICIKNIRGHQKKFFSYIPDPSKFFGDLNSHHKGNFTSWLDSVFAAESFIKVDTEFVSPVEVVKLQDAGVSRRTERNNVNPQDRWSGTAKTSNFLNSTYFLSQSSNGPSDALEPCSVHSSYGPAGGDSGQETALLQKNTVSQSDEEKDELCEALESSVKRLEKLRQDTQSPDSGFAAGGEDSLEETDLPSPLALKLHPHLPLDLPAPHLNSAPPLSWERAPFLLRPNSLFPGLDLDLDLQSPCGMLEPSSGDYMPVKNVQD